MQMKREIGSKGQIVLPKDIREYLSIKPGHKIVFEIRHGEVVIKPARTGKDFVEYFCHTSRKLKKHITIKDIKKTIEEEYDIR